MNASIFNDTMATMNWQEVERAAEERQIVLFEIFENLKNFKFHDIYCFSYHGDAMHVKTIAEAIKAANQTLHICARLVVGAMDLSLYGWSGDEDFILVSNPDYPMEWFEEQEPTYETVSKHVEEMLDLQSKDISERILNRKC